MSNLNDLTSLIGRKIAGASHAITVEVIDATGNQTTSAPTLPQPGRTVNQRHVYAQMGRIMASAHKGAVINVSLPDLGYTFSISAPGGAFDNRLVSPPPVVPQSAISPSPDLRILTPAERLLQPTRAVQIVSPGDVSFRTTGTPGEYQPTITFPGNQYLPLQVLEIGPLTTGTVIGLF
ncbi:MAG: hypothetical protein ABJL72_12125 [Roseobacter sp.]